MKILLILECSGGGSGKHVVDLARELIRLGCSVTLVYSGTRAMSDFCHEIKSVANLNVIRVDMYRSPCPSDVITLIKLRNIIKNYGPFDVIHGHSSKAGALARLAAIGMSGVSVYTPHAFRTLDPSLSTVSYKLYSIVERLLSGLGDGIILVSEGEKRHAIQIGLPENKLYVIENGMTQQELGSREDIRKRFCITGDEFCVGFVGRFVPQKAPDLLIRSFALIAHKYPKVKLLMLGNGPLQADLYSLADQLNINHQTQWLENENGAEFMPALDVFVMPSLYEAFPYVLLEAANAGLPIIATPVGGVDEMLLDKINGFLVEHDKPVELADALETLINNPQLRVSMSEASRNIGQKYSVNTMTEKTLTLYRNLLGCRA